MLPAYGELELLHRELHADGRFEALAGRSKSVEEDV